MDPRTQERVEQWDSRPFSGGYDGLSDLADSDFSGAVTASGTWLFMLNGRIVGVVDGVIEEFETATATAYEAPNPALPLLCTMEERGGETRGKYYTNETPLREVDATLQEGSFTGYVELSENVLSGDYYAVYYGGRRMAAAYIGNAERLLTGEEAFDRADDEVGIYTVVDVEIEVTDVPGTGAEPANEGGATESATGTEPAADAGATTDADPSTATSSIALDAGADDDPDVSADSTASSIDSIDLSGTGIDTDTETASADESATASPIEDVTIDAGADATELEELSSSEPSGITATDETEPEPASSGITDVGAAADAKANASADATADAAEIDDAGLETGTDDASVDEPAVESDAPSTVDSAGTDGQSADDTDGIGTTSPDLAEVEAAAEQLDQNDISWTEDDVKSSSDDESSSDETAAASAGGSTAQSAAAPESAEDGDEEGTDERFEQEAQWRETRSIPSIDPDNSASSGSKRPSNAGSDGRTESASASGARESGDASTGSSRRQSRSGTSTRGATQTERADAEGAGTGSPSNAAEASASGTEPSRTQTKAQAQDEQRVAALTEQLETLEEQRDALLAKAEQLETERDQLRSENQELSSTVDRLQTRIQQLESELERARESGDDGASTSTASTRLSPQQALAETNLFVRYGSKSQPTLESAHGGEGDQSEVASNLRLEHHTGFDAADAAVDGEPYESFLTGTMEYRFVDWLTGTVLFEVRDTGNADALGDLYDAIPRIDRAELDATISLADDETEDVPDQVGFDVVAFDKMGNPLLVANLNDSREPASQGMLEDLEAAASAVKANYPSLAAATVVTSSYFEPGALEVTEQATGGGFLSRGSKLSYVSLSRKQGYHLCLVESRSEGFHMNVPEL